MPGAVSLNVLRSMTKRALICDSVVTIFMSGTDIFFALTAMCEASERTFSPLFSLNDDCLMLRLILGEQKSNESASSVMSVSARWLMSSPSLCGS